MDEKKEIIQAGENAPESVPETAETAAVPEAAKPETEDGALFCKKCGAKLAAGQKFCPECGAAVEEQKAAKPKKEKKANSKAKKLILLFSIIGVAVIALVVVFITVFVPMIKYSSAAAKVENGEYYAAEEIYTSLGDYKDSEDLATEAHNTGVLQDNYNQAEESFAAGDYEEAIQYYKDAYGFSDAEEKLSEAYYDYGTELLASGDYVSAADAFVSAGDYSDSAEQIMECGKGLLADEDYESAVEVFDLADADDSDAYADYAQAMVDMENEEYVDAYALFQSAGDVEDAAEMVDASHLMVAEVFYNGGYLNNAKEIYESLPEDYEYDGIVVADRLALLERFSSYVALCGEWSSSDVFMTTGETSNSYGGGYSWESENNSGTLDVMCIINENEDDDGSDDTVTIVAEANFPLFTNYSSLSSRLSSSDWTTTFTDEGSSVPSSISNSDTISSYDVYQSLSINDSSFRMSYTITDALSSTYFTYEYATTATFDTLTEAY